jgi:hypothetical protein
VAEPLRRALEPRARDGHDRQAGVERAHCLDDRLGVLVRGLGDGRVERAVRLDVMQRHPRRPDEAVHGADLVERVVAGLLRRHHQRPAPETHEVRESRVRADRDARRDRGGEARADRPGIARVEPAGEVRAGHLGEQRHVVAHAPGAIGLAGIHVEIDRRLGHRVRPDV